MVLFVYFGLGLILVYLLRFANGWDVREGEGAFVRDWLRRGKSSRLNMGHLHVYSPGFLTGKIGMEFARWYENDGSPFIVLNHDHIGALGWLCLRRQRRLIDLTARRHGVPVLPIPFQPWGRAHLLGGVFAVVERKGRECVFTRTQHGIKAGQRYERETVHYLSGFDHNERPALYFLTQLPRPVTSIKDARQALKPPSVVFAEEQGIKVSRQGDMFVVPTNMTDNDIRHQGGVIASDGGCRALLYGTAHTADRIATLPSGTQLVWGTIRHKPHLINEHRPPDHHPLKLKRNTWHLVAKNATPMQLPAGEEG